MLLTVDVGNTQTVVGLYDLDGGQDAAAQGLIGHWRLSTVLERTEDETGVLVESLLRGAGFDWRTDIHGLAVSSGVAGITTSIRRLCAAVFDFEPVVVGPGIKSGISIQYDNPREVGADRIANSVAAHHLYGGPSIVVDFGTGTTFDAVTADGAYQGGAIAPGVEISMDALFGRASALSSVELVAPRQAIGKSTQDALRSGVLFGYAGLVDGLCRRFAEELGDDATIIATGGLAGLIAPHTETIEHTEPWLTLHGLRLIWQKNQ